MAHLDLQRGTWHAADTLLGKRDSRGIGHNTRLVRRSERRIAVQYHATDIYTLTPDGWAIVDTGGWSTVTTWSRVNALLPEPWGIYSHRNARTLSYGGRAVAPYADGLAVNTETGAVGFSTGHYTPVDTIMSADDVAAAVAADDAKTAARAVARAARLKREHNIGAAPLPGYGMVTRNGVPVRAYHPVRGSRYGMSDGLVNDCPDCRPIWAAEHAAHLERLTAEHDAGLHVREERRAEWPRLASGATDYNGTPTYTTVTVPSCPWECPTGRAGRGY